MNTLKLDREDTAGVRQLRFRVNGESLHLFKQKGESTHQVSLKVAAYALYGSSYRLEFDPRVAIKFQPSLAEIDFTGEVKVWVRVGAIVADQVAYILKHTDAEEVVLVTEDIDLEDAVAHLKRHIHYRYTTGKLRIVVFRPLEEWFHPDDVVVRRANYQLFEF